MEKDYNTTGKVLKVMIAVVLPLILGGSAILFSYFRTPGMQYRHNLNLGNKYLLAMQYDDAVNAFTRAIDIEPKAADAYVGRGDAYAGLKQDEKAQADYVKAVELNPELNDKIQEKISGLDITPIPTPTPTQTEAPKTFGGVVSLERDIATETDLNNDGIIDRITYSLAAKTLYSVDDIILNVNGVEFHDKPDSQIFSTGEKAYASDVNVKDSYKNIFLVFTVNGTYVTYMYAYNQREIKRIDILSGTLKINNISGDGKIENVFFHDWGSDPDGIIYFKNIQMIQDLDSTQESLTVGHLLQENDTETFVDGYTVTATKDIKLYSDEMCTQEQDTISAGETFQIINYKIVNDTYYYTNYQITSTEGTGWIKDQNLYVLGYEGFG